MRVNNYNRLLVEWADRQLGKPYVWGKTDCGTIAREGLAVMLGQDPFPGLPSWNSEAEMRSVWGVLGGSDAGFVHFGAKRIEPNYAQTGDVILVRIKDIEASALIIDNKMLFCFFDKGVGYRKTVSINNKHYRIYRFK